MARIEPRTPFIDILRANLSSKFYITIQNKKAKTYQIGDDDHSTYSRSTTRKKNYFQP